MGNKKWKLSTVPRSIQITSRDSFDTKLSLLCKVPHQPAGSQLCMGRSGGHICFPFCRFGDEPSVWPHPEQPAWGWLTSSPPPAPGSLSAARCRFFFYFFFFFSSLTAHKPEPSLLSLGTGRRWFVWFAAAPAAGTAAAALYHSRVSCVWSEQTKPGIVLCPGMALKQWDLSLYRGKKKKVIINAAEI